MLGRHEISAWRSRSSVLCFAVVAAILLVRTRERLAASTADARDEIIASRAEVDRVYALLRSEPQILVAWAAADDEPEIVGDDSLVTDADTPYRVLAFGLWLEPETAQTMESAVEAPARARREILHGAHHARGPPDRGRRPGGGRACDPAVQGRERRQARARGTARPLPAPGRRRRRHAQPDRGAALADLGARRGRQADLRQRRLCARRRGQGRRRGDRSAASSCSTARRAPTCSAPTKPSSASPAGCPRSSPAAAASFSTC